MVERPDLKQDEVVYLAASGGQGRPTPLRLTMRTRFSSKPTVSCSGCGRPWAKRPEHG